MADGIDSASTLEPHSSLSAEVSACLGSQKLSPDNCIYLVNQIEHSRYYLLTSSISKLPHDSDNRNLYLHLNPEIFSSLITIFIEAR
ncbi:hypothetical protein NPIL_111521 [Nephila pilipes]|uniref:Uncharacterized protein n=1 Tax=Nephila pilipes TaxID=299642 RepID=A0A8X6MX92_NEPPI|nr:hypothetical protein NPIL_111521 [Nephila pilipes]